MAERVNRFDSLLVEGIVSLKATLGSVLVTVLTLGAVLGGVWAVLGVALEAPPCVDRIRRDQSGLNRTLVARI